MSKILNLPKLSPTMEEGVLAKWFKKPGDSFEVDDLLAEVETDKATMEFRAFEKGTLLKILAEEGSVVKLGGDLAIVGNPGESISETVAENKKSEDIKEVISSNPNNDKKEEIKTDTSKNANDIGILIRTQLLPDNNILINNDLSKSVIASPRVRKEAREKNINLNSVVGSGSNGRILIEDLSNSRSEAVKKITEEISSERVPLSQMRKTIAKRLTQSKRDVPHFYLTTEINMSKLISARTDIIKSINNENIKPTINDFIIMASSRALALNPACNVSYDDDFIVKHKNINTSVAVAIPDGLVTPVIRNSDKLSIKEIHLEVKRLAELAKNKKLKIEEMQGGTYSVSNLGSYGVSEFSAVINPPEGFILAVGSASETGIMKITMSCDHRVIDGAVGATYLKDLKKLLENPIILFAGV